MMPRWANLDESDRAAFHAAKEFLSGRLEERATVDWALRLKPNETIKRLALLDRIDSPDGRKISEPWLSAWRLIEESWDNPQIEGCALIDKYAAQERLRQGDRSGPLVAAIAGLVAPRLKVKSLSDSYLRLRKPPRRPRRGEDLLWAGLTSGEVVDPEVLELEALTDGPFLVRLANALDSAVSNGLDIARRIGWDGKRRSWPLGQLHRVYYVGEDDPDEHNKGIAPSVKLLHAVVMRLLDVDISAALEFVRQWEDPSRPIHIRLWAALSRDSRVACSAEVGALLLSLDGQAFWNLHDYPEIAELRATRFGELDPHEQAALTARIRKRPPRNMWPKKTDASRMDNSRTYWAVRELRRIETAGASLPKLDRIWLDARIHEFPDLAQMARLDQDFPFSAKAYFVPPNPDSRYGLLAGEERLKALERALLSTRVGWDDDPAKRAVDWIRELGNPVQILADLESVPDGGSAFPMVWDRFGWAHSPEVKQDENAVQRDISTENARVLSLLDRLPEIPLRQAIEGISFWLSTWAKPVVASPNGLCVWLRLWPIAVELANAKKSAEEEESLNTVAQSSDGREPMDLDTLNTPVGRLVGVFLVACPTIRLGDTPFSENNAQRQMRDAVEESIGPAGLNVKYRLIENLGYFLKADPEWTKTNLVPPLMGDGSDARVLWRAVGRQIRFFDELEVIGEEMVKRATDQQLHRETRQSLVFSLVVECLSAFLDGREPAVPCADVLQMLRCLDDEVRTYAAEAVTRFVNDNSKAHEGEIPCSSAHVFRTAAMPFLQQVWPQERSLATPGVSRALADLPATAGEAFADAVVVIERFLVPFECWSIHDYGFYEKWNERASLSSIDNPQKAEAFLRLLDLTIGTAEGSVIPYDLADALDQVRKAASPQPLEARQEFRRLATAARRV